MTSLGVLAMEAMEASKFEVQMLNFAYWPKLGRSNSSLLETS